MYHFYLLITEIRGSYLKLHTAYITKQYKRKANAIKYGLKTIKNKKYQVELMAREKGSQVEHTLSNAYADAIGLKILTINNKIERPIYKK